VIKVYGAQAQEAERFGTINLKLRRFALKMQVPWSAATPVTQVIAAIGLAIVISVALYQARIGHFSPGDFITFLTAAMLLLPPAAGIALAGAGMAGRRPMRLRRPPQEAVAELIAAAGKADAPAFGAHLARCLDITSAPAWRFEESERHDFLALAVSAIGLCEEDAIRIFLTLVPEIARSVAAVFGLVDIFRRTPRSVSAMILEAALDLQIVSRAGPQVSPQHGQDLADRAGPAMRISGKIPGAREWGRQVRPQLPDRAG